MGGTTKLPHTWVVARGSGDSDDKVQCEIDGIRKGGTVALPGVEVSRKRVVHAFFPHFLPFALYFFFRKRGLYAKTET